MNHHVLVSASFATSVADVFAALTDYNQYKEWVPGIKRSQVLVREGDIVVVEFEAPGFSVQPMTFEFVHNPPAQIIYQQVGQYRERGLSGEWSIDDSAGANRVQVRGRATIRAPFYIFSIKKRLQTALHEGLDALRAHIGATSDEQEVLVAGRRIKLLEVRRQRDGLEVWYQGRVFTCSAERSEIKI